MESIGAKMKKITLKIDGMMCTMCEAHMNETVRKALPGAEKISSSHKKGTTSFVAEGPVDYDALASAIGATGYTLSGHSEEPYEKKRFSFFGK